MLRQADLSVSACDGEIARFPMPRRCSHQAEKGPAGARARRGQGPLQPPRWRAGRDERAIAADYRSRPAPGRRYAVRSTDLSC